MAITWGVAVGVSSGAQFRIGYEFIQNPINSEIVASTNNVVLDLHIYIWTRYKVTDAVNSLVVSGGFTFNNDVSIATISSSPSWSESNIQHLQTLTKNITPSAFSSVTTQFSATLTGINNVGTSYVAKVSGSKTTSKKPLPKSIPTLSSSNFVTGTSITITTNRQNPVYTHDISWNFNGHTGVIATGVGASTTFNFPRATFEPLSVYRTSGGTITCETYDGVNLIGVSSVPFTITIPTAQLGNVTCEATTSTEITNIRKTRSPFLLDLNVGTSSVFGFQYTKMRNTKLPYRVIVTNYKGEFFAELENAYISSISWSLNDIGTMSFSMPSRDPKISECKVPYREVQVWKGKKIIWWGVLTKARRGNAGVIDYDCEDLLWYFTRRVIGTSKAQANLIKNGTFERGLLNWELGFDSDSTPASPPIAKTVRGEGRAVSSPTGENGAYIWPRALLLRGSSDTSTEMKQYAAQTVKVINPTTTGGNLTLRAVAWLNVDVYRSPAKDEAGLTLRAVCSDEQDGVVNYAGSVLADGPQVYYKLNETTTTGGAKDYSPNLLNASYTGTVTLGESKVIEQSEDTAMTISTEGNNGVTIAYNASWMVLPNEFTLEAIVRLKIDSNQSMTLFAQNGDSTTWRLYVRDKKLIFAIHENTWGDAISNTLLKNDGLYHVAAVKTTSGHFVYLNGKLVGSFKGYKSPTIKTGPITIGFRPNKDDAFFGDIGNVAIYKKALTPAEVLDHASVSVASVSPVTPSETLAANILINPSTVRDTWIRCAASIQIPPDGKTYDVTTKLYAINGDVIWDEVTLTKAEQLQYRNAEQAEIVADLVDYAQSTTVGKTSLGIGSYCMPTGVSRTRVFDASDHQTIWDALKDFTTLHDGMDIDISYEEPDQRWLRTYYPYKGGDPQSAFFNAPVLSLGSNVRAYTVDWDGTETANQIFIQQKNNGASDIDEAVATDISYMDGLMLEKVYEATPGSFYGSLQLQAERGLDYFSVPVVIPSITMMPEYVDEILSTVKPGTFVRVIIKDEYASIDGNYRVTQVNIDPNTNEITLALATGRSFSE